MRTEIETRATGLAQPKPRLVGALMGDIVRGPSTRTKYGAFFSVLRRHFPFVDVYDARLSGIPKITTALLTVRPNRRRWRERFYKNVPAFRARSERIAAYLEAMQPPAEVVLQIGVLFDARWASGPPSVIYADYTARLSAQNPAAGRSPFNREELEDWVALERQALERATHICTRSHLVFRSIVEDYGVPAERVSVIGGGVNFATLPTVDGQPETDEPTVLFIGKDFYRKGGDLLLQAFARVRAELPNAKLVLVTGDHIPDGLPLAGVQVIESTWDRRAIADLYRRAHVFALPSRLETWGDVLLEAMSYGLPCVAVEGDAMSEIIIHGETGLVAPSGNVAALAQALTFLLSDAQRRTEWGLAGRRRVEDHFTWERVVDRLTPILVDTARSTTRV